MHSFARQPPSLKEIYEHGGIAPDPVRFEIFADVCGQLALDLLLACICLTPVPPGGAMDFLMVPLSDSDEVEAVVAFLSLSLSFM